MNTRDKRNCMLIVTLSIVLILCLTLAFTLTACNKPTHEHKWDNGTVTPPTCAMAGEIIYSCEECEETMKEVLEATGNHSWETTIYDKDNHKNVCSTCGTSNLEEHDFDGNIYDSVDKLMNCECGYSVTVGEYYSYKVNFECDAGITLLIYDTQDYSEKGVISTVAYARDGETGKLSNSGKGEVNFEVNAPLGYKLSAINISVESNAGYEDILEPNSTAKKNTYRITKIASELTVKVETEIEIDYLELPVIVINTENNAQILDKENYVSCNVSVRNAEQYCFEEEEAGIRGRGNSTWQMAKKPYRLKFNSKVDLFGNGKAKSWTLIANYCDQSLSRNYFAYSIGAQFDSLEETTTTMQMVELYLNGQYDGVYLVCEQVQTGKNRVDVSEEIADTDGNALLDTGYLIELDGRAPSEGVLDYDYFYLDDYDYGDRAYGFSHEKYYAIKSPDNDDFADLNLDYTEFVNFIKEYVDTCLQTIVSGDYNRVKNLIDVDSFAEAYIVNELFNNKDVGQSSFYMYKDAGGKLYCGPIWDFDISSGNCDFNDTLYQDHGSWEYDCLWAKESNIWFAYLLKIQEFQALVSSKLSSYKDAIADTISQCVEYVESCSQSMERNFQRWNILGIDVSPNSPEMVAIKTWQGQVEYLRDWLLNSLDYMLSIYCDEQFI